MKGLDMVKEVAGGSDRGSGGGDLGDTEGRCRCEADRREEAVRGGERGEALTEGGREGQKMVAGHEWRRREAFAAAAAMGNSVYFDSSGYLFYELFKTEANSKLNVLVIQFLCAAAAAMENIISRSHYSYVSGHVSSSDKSARHIVESI